MDTRPWIAVCGTLLLHVAVVASMLMIADPIKVPEVKRPLTVRLLEAPKPLPISAAPAPSPAQSPKPIEAPTPALPPPPSRPKPSQPPPSPAVQPKPAPEKIRQSVARPKPPDRPKPAVLVDTRPQQEQRPASITAEPTPTDSPPATDARVPEPVQARPVAPPVAPNPPVRTGPRLEANWIGNEPPAYPAMARRLGEQGEVRLDVLVTATGHVTEIKLKKSSGSQLLDQTTIDTVKKWKFQPATVDGQPVAAWYRDWKWVFKLEN
jgi:protein TonB